MEFQRPHQEPEDHQAGDGGHVPAGLGLEDAASDGKPPGQEQPHVNGGSDQAQLPGKAAPDPGDPADIGDQK